MDFQSQETIVTVKAENETMVMNELGDGETQVPLQSETQPTQTVLDSNQNLRSGVWKEYVSVGKGIDGKERGRCIHCNKQLVIERTHGTSHLKRHVLSCQQKDPRKKNGGSSDGNKHNNSVDVVRASVSKSSCDREGVSNGLSVKRQRSSTTSEDKTRSAMLLGVDILDCPVCFEALTIPIFQCDNGHLVCSSCCPKLSNKCHTCDSPVGHNRCRAMETVIESVFVPCRNNKFGCTVNLPYGKESTHEKEECSFSQCSCPALDCNYTGSYSNIYSHFVDEHCHNTKSVSFVCGGSIDVQMNIANEKILVLWEFKKRLLFALQCFDEPQGLYVTVRCIAPSVPEVEKLAYCLYYYSMDGHTLTYKSPEVKKVLQVSFQTPQDNFMFVPHSLLCGELLELKIGVGLEVRAARDHSM